MKQGKTNFLLMWSQFKNYKLDNASLRVIHEIWYVHSDKHSSQMTLRTRSPTVTPCNAHDPQMIAEKKFGVQCPEINSSVAQSSLNWDFSSSKSKLLLPNTPIFIDYDKCIKFSYILQSKRNISNIQNTFTGGIAIVTT
jgi:hypothetical protein